MSKPEPSYSGSAPYLFVSYAHLDRDIVDPEISQLQQQGFNVWYDEGIGAGLSWRDEVALAISESSLFIIFMTPNSVTSAVCRQEVFFALSRERKILVVYLEDCELSPGMELGLSDRQAIFRHALVPDEYQRKLMAAVRASVITVDQTAQEWEELSRGSGVAILPLATHGGNEEVSYLSEGIAEALLTDLARIKDLRVISAFGTQNQTLDVRNLGLKFKVATVLHGSIQQSGNRIRINMRLTSTEDGEVLWVDGYDFQMTDIFDVQDSVAAGVLKALRFEPAPHEGLGVGTGDIAAYEAYLHGLFEKRKASQTGWESAVEHFRLATRLDPQFSRAWYNLGLSYWELTAFLGRNESLEKPAEEAFERARKQGYQPEIPWIQIERKIHPEDRPGQQALAAEALEIVAARTNAWQSFELVQLGRCLGAAGLFQASYHFLSAYLLRVSLPMKEVEEVRFEADGLLPILGKFNAAIERLTDQLAEFPEDRAARLERCMLYSRTGQYLSADEDLDLLDDPELSMFARFHQLCWRGQTEQGAIEEAEHLLADILASGLKPRFKFRGCALLGRDAEAVRHMAESAERGAPIFHIRTLLANALPQKRLAELEATDDFKHFLLDHGIETGWPEQLTQMLNNHSKLTNIRI